MKKLIAKIRSFLSWMNPMNWERATFFYFGLLLYAFIITFNLWVLTRNVTIAVIAMNTIFLGYMFYSDYWARRDQDTIDDREIELKRTQLFIQMFNSFTSRTRTRSHDYPTDNSMN